MISGAFVTALVGAEVPAQTTRRLEPVLKLHEFLRSTRPLTLDAGATSVVAAPAVSAAADENEPPIFDGTETPLTPLIVRLRHRPSGRPRRRRPTPPPSCVRW